jgi:methyl-accepting chemotaxis protein
MFKNTSIFVRIIAIIVLSNALFILFVFIFTLPNIKTGIFDERKQSLKNPVEMVYSLLDSLNNKVVLGQLTLEEAKIKAIETVPKLKYDDGKNYVWLHNSKNIFIVHPNKKLINKDMSDASDNNGVKYIAEMTKVALANGYGYVSYSFPKPTDLEHPLPKISYVKYFKQWDLVIGTGTWVDDVENHISSITNSIIFGSVIIVILSILWYFY